MNPTTKKTTKPRPRTTAPLPLEALAALSLKHGAHEDRSNGLCLLEVVAWVAGEKHSDHPTCVSPVISAFGRAWNDALPTDADRDRLLKPLIPLMIGTRTGSADETTRAWLATDWLVRVQAPAWMSLSDVLKGHAETLRNLPPITSAAAARKAQPSLDAARSAAAAAGATAGAAAWATAGAAAGAAARAAARATAGAAARATAWAAARDAARAAAGDALAPTVTTLQESAVELVRAMCAVGRVTE